MGATRCPISLVCSFRRSAGSTTPSRHAPKWRSGCSPASRWSRHGYPKFLNPTPSAEWFEEIGFEPGLFWTYAVGTVEVAGGLCLAIGFLTRVAAVPILVFLATAITYHWQFGFYWNMRGFEYPLFWWLVVFHFLIRGGGPCSVDTWLGGRSSLHTTARNAASISVHAWAQSSQARAQMRQCLCMSP